MEHGSDFDKYVKIFDYNQNIVRFTSSNCKCIICEVGKLNGKHPNIYCTKVKVQPVKSQNKVCSKCLTTIAKGVQHDCTEATRKKNILALAAEEGFVVSKDVDKNFKVTINDLARIKTRMNLSDNDIKTLSYELRRCNDSYNRKIIEPHALQALSEYSHSIDSYFSLTQREGSCNPVVYCNDTIGFVEQIISKRKYEKENVHLKIGADSGGGSLKINVCVVDKKNSNDQKSKEKDSGVKKMFILALTDDTKESYDLIIFLWNLLKMNNLLDNYDCSFNADLKLIMIACGLMSNSSKCPCPYCDTSDLSIKGIYIINSYN